MREDEMMTKVCPEMTAPPPVDAPQMGPSFVFCQGSACAMWETGYNDVHGNKTGTCGKKR